MKPTLAVLVCLSGLVATAAGAGPKFELRDGDRVVLIGDALIERDQEYGYLETLLTLQDPDKSITFRNLGWSGDTVFGDARAGFGTQADGFARLKEHILAHKPTVVIVGYGMTDSFAGEAGLTRFVEGLNALLDVIAETKARVVLLSPIAHEDLGRPLPDPAGHNRSLRMYRDAIEKVAGDRGHRFVDLLDVFKPGSSPRAPAPRNRLTDDGIHPTEFGHWVLSLLLAYEISEDFPGGSDVLISYDGNRFHSNGSRISGVEATATKLRFVMLCESLPPPPSPPSNSTIFGSIHTPKISVKLIPPGRYALKVDGQKVASAEAAFWDREGVDVSQGPEYDQVERLRKAINEKNRLYFYRWRPQNETYLFGFRKHEQGNNAREIPLFDPLVDAKEAEITSLKKPVSHVYELIREGEVGR